ncbi:hypothetical protein GMLC_04690 [Geomonas limicola]|uniref:Uncharacterized protein n=1 Tax=Geomonas limicola TaxID=2740186 RepID=A0A6V8N3F2_9BACT|nr:hypothetical protein GMLC_04690 [Geomonas limicola]
MVPVPLINIPYANRSCRSPFKRASSLPEVLQPPLAPPLKKGGQGGGRLYPARPSPIPYLQSRILR